MPIEIHSYEGLKGYPFGSLPTLFMNTLGTPTIQRKNRSGETTLHYDGVVICFDSETEGFREATFAYNTPIRLNGANLDWSSEGLCRLCAQDDNPIEVHGAILLLQLGVSVTGITDDEVGNRALSAFRRGDWDEFKSEFRPWEGR